jgi:hypothetical protein
MRTAALVLALGGCWRGEPAAPSARPVHATRAHVVAAAPPTEIAIPTTTPNVELAQRLSDALQLGWLGTTIDRVVVLDDAGLRSVCDRAAQTEAQGWELMLSDPRRAAVQCYEVTPATDYLCGQAATRGPYVLMHFVKSPTGWHLVSVVLGANALSVRAELPRIDAELEHGVCP